MPVHFPDFYGGPPFTIMPGDTMRAPPAVLLPQTRMAQSDRGTYGAHEEISTADWSIAGGQAKGTPSAGRQPQATPVDVRGASTLVRHEPFRQQRELLRPSGHQAVARGEGRGARAIQQSPTFTFLVPWLWGLSKHPFHRGNSSRAGGLPDAYPIITVPMNTYQGKLSRIARRL
jgi:hypothetical protein